MKSEGEIGTIVLMPQRPRHQEPAFLRERATRLRAMAANAMPPSISGPLLELAAELEKRAERLERSDDGSPLDQAP